MGLVPMARASSPDGHGGLSPSPAREPWPTTASCWSPSAAMPGTRTGPVSTMIGGPHSRIPRDGPKRRLSLLSVPAVGCGWVREAGPAVDGSRAGMGWEMFPCIPLVLLLELSPAREVPAARPAPRQRGAGRDGWGAWRGEGSGAEPGDSQPMAFPGCKQGCAREQKGLYPLSRAGGAGSGLSTHSHPISSHLTPSHQPHGTFLPSL